jgi:hypothetical protein
LLLSEPVLVSTVEGMMFSYRMDHVCSVVIQLSPPQRIGPVPEGLRLIFLAKGGRGHRPEGEG